MLMCFRCVNFHEELQLITCEDFIGPISISDYFNETLNRCYEQSLEMALVYFINTMTKQGPRSGQ